MSDKYAALKQAAQEETMCRESGDTSDAWQDEASPECILELLAERDADKARIGSLRLTLRRLRLENADLEAQTLTVKLPDCDLGSVQHMSGGSDDYCNGFVDGTQNAIKALKAACAAAGISLKIEGE